MTELVFDERSGKWAEPPPGPCDLGHPPNRVLVGWLPCTCSGHRYYICLSDGHADDRDFGHRPPLTPECRAGSRIMGPDAGLPGSAG